MGSADGNSNERPIHHVEISSFHLDRTVVTNRQYAEFLRENPAWRKDTISREMADGDYLNLWDGIQYPEELGDHSVINVSWFAAAAYANWKGQRLPSEAEWEYAAGGPRHCKWSLAKEFDPSLYAFNYREDPIGFRVASYPANGYGLFEMSGGVWEWTQDFYEVDYYVRAADKDPVNLIETNWKALRGGSCLFDDPNYLRCAVRGSNKPNACHEDYGFRCAL